MSTNGSRRFIQAGGGVSWRRRGSNSLDDWVGYARLQGAGDFNLDGFRDSQIQYAFGDAVAVPAVTWLMEQAVVPALLKGEFDDA